MYIYISIYEYIFKYMYIHGTQPLSQNKIPGSSYVLPTKAFPEQHPSTTTLPHLGLQRPVATANVVLKTPKVKPLIGI